MKRTFITFMFTASLLALPGAAQAITFQFIASLDGAQEVPASGALATGLAALFYDDNNSVVTSDDSYSFSLAAFGLTGIATGMHIHAPAAAGFTGPVVVSLTTPTFLVLNAGGSLLIGGADVTPPSTLLGQLQSGLAYINIHTAAFPGGEIRGQLLQACPVPEPSTYAMLLAGLGLIGMVTRHRSKALDSATL